MRQDVWCEDHWAMGWVWLLCGRLGTIVLHWRRRERLVSYVGNPRIFCTAWPSCPPAPLRRTSSGGEGEAKRTSCLWVTRRFCARHRWWAWGQSPTGGRAAGHSSWSQCGRGTVPLQDSALPLALAAGERWGDWPGGDRVQPAAHRVQPAAQRVQQTAQRVAGGRHGEGSERENLAWRWKSAV